MGRVRYVVLAIGGAGLAAALSGCGSSGASSASTTTTMNSASTTMISTTTTMNATSTTLNLQPQGLPTPALVRTGSFSAHFPGGYSAGGTLRTGQLAHDTPMILEGDTLGDGCAVNTQTDAVVPFLLTVRNTTSHFALTSSWQVVLDDNSTSDETQNLSVESVVGGQPTCYGAEESADSDNDGEPEAAFQTTLQPGQSTEVGGFVIVGSYYSPASPSGSLGEIDNVAMYVDAAQIGSGAGTVTGGNGMTSASESDNEPAAAMPLDAAENLSSDCTVSNPGECP